MKEPTLWGCHEDVKYLAQCLVQNTVSFCYFYTKEEKEKLVIE